MCFIRRDESLRWSSYAESYVCIQICIRTYTLPRNRRQILGLLGRLCETAHDALVSGNRINYFQSETAQSPKSLRYVESHRSYSLRSENMDTHVSLQKWCVYTNTKASERIYPHWLQPSLPIFFWWCKRLSQSLEYGRQELYSKSTSCFCFCFFKKLVHFYNFWLIPKNTLYLG